MTPELPSLPPLPPFVFAFAAPAPFRREPLRLRRLCRRRRFRCRHARLFRWFLRLLTHDYHETILRNLRLFHRFRVFQHFPFVHKDQEIRLWPERRVFGHREFFASQNCRRRRVAHVDVELLRRSVVLYPTRGRRRDARAFRVRVVLDPGNLDWKKRIKRRRDKRNPSKRRDPKGWSKATKKRAPRKTSRARRTAFSSESSWRPLSLSLSLGRGVFGRRRPKRMSFLKPDQKAWKRLKNPKFMREKKQLRKHDWGKM